MGFGVEYLRWLPQAQVINVQKDGPAAIAGVRVGDRIDIRQVSFTERYWLRAIRSDWALPAGQTFRLTLHRSGAIVRTTVIAKATPAEWGTWTGWLTSLATLWGLCFAALLAVRRPDLRQARILALILLTYFGTSQVAEGVAPWAAIDFAVYVVAIVVFHAAPITLLALFSAMFGRPLAPMRKLLTYISMGLALTAAASSFALSLLWYVAALPADSIRTFIVGNFVALGCITSLLCAFAAISSSAGRDQQRIGWVTASVSPVWVTWAVSYVGGPLFGQPVVNALASIADPASIAMPIGLTYATLTRRFIDVGFFITRTVVFAAISLVVLAVFVVVEWLLSEWVTNASHATGIVVNVCVALVLGLTMRFTHRRIERLVNRVLFRKRHNDETALRRFSHEVAFIGDLETMLERTRAVVLRHSETNSVSIWLANGSGSYVQVHEDGHARSIDQNDPAVLAMRTWHDPVDLHTCESNLQGDHAFPMITRGNLAGILLCGSKLSGEAYAPDECESLARVAQSVGSALDSFRESHTDVQSQILEAQRQILAEIRALHEKME